MQAETIGAYLDALASAAPAPGGGAAAALTGAQAAGLLAMVAALTPDLSSEQPSLAAAAKDFLSLAERDAKAFSAVAAAYKLPRATDAEKAARSAAIQEALVGATEAPLAVMEAADALMARAEKMAAHANPNVISDLGIGALLGAAAARAAHFNVRINLKLLKDETRRAQFADRARVILQSVETREKSLSVAVDELL